MSDRFYDKTVKQTEENLRTDADRGLTNKEAARRLRRHGERTVFPIPHLTFWEHLKQSGIDFLSILLILTAVISWIFERKTDSAVIFGILLVHYAVSLTLYVRSQRVFEDMGRFSLPTSKVMREGRLYELKSELLVEGDLLLLSAGDILPCDARLVSAEGLFALEVNLTGEARPAEKDHEFLRYTRDLPPAHQKNMLFASTIITKGTGRAIVCAVGDDTLVTKLQKNPSVVSHDKLKVIAFLKRCSAASSLAMMGLIFAVSLLSFATGYASHGLINIFLNALSLGVAAMSELYAAFAFLLIAGGVFRALKREKETNTGAVIKNIAKLEELKDVTTLLVDREGALTLDDIYIDRVFACGRNYRINQDEMNEQAGRVMRYALLSTASYSTKSLSGGKNPNRSEQNAIVEGAKKHRVLTPSLEQEYALYDFAPKSQTSRFDTALVRHGDGFETAVRGEIEDILASCAYCYTDDGVSLMTPDQMSRFRVAAFMMIKEGYKVVGVASKKVIYNNLCRLASCQTGMIFEGFLALSEQLLPDAAKNVQKCREAGIKVILMTEDTEPHSLAIARSLGVLQDESEAITGRGISEMKDALFLTDAAKYRLYMGLNVHQKRRLLSNLQESGEKVAVYCRELDEIILLKEADVGFIRGKTVPRAAQKNRREIRDSRSVALGATAKENAAVGSETMKFVSDVIVSAADRRGNGGFNAMLSAVENAKNVFFNMEKAFRYLLVSQIAKTVIVLLSVFLGSDIMKPLQILFCGLIADFAAIVVLAFEKPESDVLQLSGKRAGGLALFFKENLHRMLFGVVWAVLSYAMPALLEHQGFVSHEQALSAVFLSFLATQAVLLAESMRNGSLFAAKKNVNGAYLLYLLSLILFALLCTLVPPVGALFGIVPLNRYALIGLLAVPLVMLLMHEIYCYVSRNVNEK
ncbi:MAG: cation-transporting P-type ATPase [Ruminococcaceae bacterium]|nr:cation-transporting P-type ATPase [Oscillospiraceae bacterium]